VSQEKTIRISHNFRAANLQATSPNSRTFVTSEFLTAELLKVLVVWNVSPHRLVDDVYAWKERGTFIYKAMQSRRTSARK